MLGGLGRSILWAAAALIFGTAATPGLAEFPPDGSVADPNNPSIASGVYALPTRDGVGRRYVFYFDCGIGMWIGVAVAGGEQAQSITALGPGREFPSGSPPGARRDPTDQRHAINETTGQEFVFRGGSWWDTKTGVAVKSPKLCTGTSFAPARPRTKGLGETGGTLGDKPLFRDAYRPPIGDQDTAAPQKPDKLPAPAAYLPDPQHGVLDPSKGPIRISIPRPDGRADVLH